MRMGPSILGLGWSRPWHFVAITFSFQGLSCLGEGKSALGNFFFPFTYLSMAQSERKTDVMSSAKKEQVTYVGRADHLASINQEIGFRPRSNLSSNHQSLVLLRFCQPRQLGNPWIQRHHRAFRSVSSLTPQSRVTLDYFGVLGKIVNGQLLLCSLTG
ncbi:hypothetical protein BJY01DRAFT_9295 [Aspergillus pseudoustus]|uniref:Uncharacterized protein n=1 Tax=Aspergillus pseudoustus TaxID=1810923 RepID=A0ABR4JN09_9EURO